MLLVLARLAFISQKSCQRKPQPKTKTTLRSGRSFATGETPLKRFLFERGEGTRAAKRVLNDKRKRLIKGRIKEGYTVEQLKKAVDGCLCSPWHRGQNPNGVVYDDITLICRDATKVDQFVDMSARYGGGEDEAQDQYLEEVVQQTIERRKRVRRGIGKRGEN